MKCGEKINSLRNAKSLSQPEMAENAGNEQYSFRETWENVMGLLVGPACLVSVILFFAFPSESNGQSAVESQAWKEEIAALVRAAVAEGAPSIQLALGFNGSLIFEAAYGLADVENNVPATTETRYQTASISKWLTATAVMVLVDEGTLDLDAPVQKYCPAFPENSWTITTRHLLSHTSGIRHHTDYSEELAKAKNDVERAMIERKQLLNRLSYYTRYTDMQAPLETFKNDPLLFEPGTAFSYSSFGYALLGCVLEGAGGRPYRTIMKEKVFDPANVAIIDYDVFEIIPHRATGYSLSRPSGSGLSRAALRDVSQVLPGGGYIATAGELVRFALAFQSGELIKDQSKAILKSTYLMENGEPANPNFGHGVQLMESNLGTGNYIYHQGGHAGTTTILFLQPDLGLAAAIMSNVDYWRGLWPLLEAAEPIIFKALLGKE